MFGRAAIGLGIGPHSSYDNMYDERTHAIRRAA